MEELKFYTPKKVYRSYDNDKEYSMEDIIRDYVFHRNLLDKTTFKEYLKSCNVVGVCEHCDMHECNCNELQLIKINKHVYELINIVILEYDSIFKYRLILRRGTQYLATFMTEMLKIRQNVLVIDSKNIEV